MNTRKLYTKIGLVLLWMTLVMGGCSTDLLNEEPPHLIVSETLYTTLDGFEAGLNGLYALTRWEREGRSSDNFLRSDLATTGTDNVTPNNRSGFGALTEQWNTNNHSQNTEVTSFFNWMYQLINAANGIINRAEENEGIDWVGSAPPEESRNRILAEARALRAWAYRHLVYGWGDVPLTLVESVGSNIRTDWERTPTVEVRQQMKEDWLFAESHLGVEPSVRGRITKGAVQHYLSELYLTLGNADSAIYWADQCIETPAYQLITERYGVRQDQPGVVFMDMFYDGNSNREEGNTEALWVWQWEFQVPGGGGSNIRRWISNSDSHAQIVIDGVAPIQMTVERGGRGLSRIAMTKWAIDVYESDDDRGSEYAIRKFYVLKDAAGNAPNPADRLPPGYQYGDTVHLNWDLDLSTDNRNRRDWPHSRKFDSTPVTNAQSGNQFNDQAYLRLAETYLLKAEAQYRLGNLSGAAETLNIIRRRANAQVITAQDVTIDFILDERSRELIHEEHRRYTLLRTGKWLERVSQYNNNGGQTAALRDTLLPIPQTVIDANLSREFPQNPGF